MEWKTRITELLGCRYPILQGALSGFGNWQLAAAVAEAGARGTLTAAVSRTPEKLREDVKRFKDATGGKQAWVNLSFTSCPQIENMLEVCIEEGAGVETSTYKPDSLAPRIKEAGLKWVHKSARMKDAFHAQCKGCHSDRREKDEDLMASEKRAPVVCDGCHVPKKEEEGAMHKKEEKK